MAAAVEQVSLGYEHSCALLEGGTVACWGLIFGYDSVHLEPLVIAGAADVAEVAVGTAHGCARMRDGTVRCWGFNNQGQLGDGTTVDRTMPVSVIGIAGATQLAVGSVHSCALVRGGRVWCWGLLNSASPRWPVAAAVEGLMGVVEIACGVSHSCARTGDGRVWCWGGNANGQLGDGTTMDHDSPAPVEGLSRVTGLSTGSTAIHVCARLEDGTAMCWGSNFHGQLGDGTTTMRTSPVFVSGLDHVVQIAAGGQHTCAIREAGNAMCWGENARGEVGDGTTVDRLEPTFVRTR